MNNEYKSITGNEYLAYKKGISARLPDIQFLSYTFVMYNKHYLTFLCGLLVWLQFFSLQADCSKLCYLFYLTAEKSDYVLITLQDSKIDCTFHRTKTKEIIFAVIQR